MRRGIRTARYKSLFTTPDSVLLGESPTDPQALDGQLYDLIADPCETTSVFRSKPEVVRQLLKRYRASMAAPFHRFDAARSSEQPRSAFAISARHMVTEIPLPKATGRGPPDGWTRVKRGKHASITNNNSDDPLSIHFPLPNGSYKLSLRMEGRAVVEVDNQRRELTGEEMVEFGEINVTDEVFRATIRPRGIQPVTLSYFGFVPPGASGQDSDAAKEQLERLRALGYID